jgi:hypothetical protein
LQHTGFLAENLAAWLILDGEQDPFIRITLSFLVSEIPGVSQTEGVVGHAHIINFQELFWSEGLLSWLTLLIFHDFGKKISGTAPLI